MKINLQNCLENFKPNNSVEPTLTTIEYVETILVCKERWVLNMNSLYGIMIRHNYLSLNWP